LPGRQRRFCFCRTRDCEDSGFGSGPSLSASSWCRWCICWQSLRGTLLANCPLPTVLRARSPCLFRALHSYWRSPELGGVWYKSRRRKNKRFAPPLRAGGRWCRWCICWQSPPGRCFRALPTSNTPWLAPAPYTLHSTPCTLHPTPYTLHSTPYTLQPKPYTLHPTPYNLQPTPYTLHPTTDTLQPTPCTLHPTPYTFHPSPMTLKPKSYGLNPKH